MSGPIHSPSFVIRRSRGVALLMVLIVIFAITIISMGFLSRCDVELACGQNVSLRTQMDQLVDSGLEHARGLILQPHDVNDPFWPGAVGQQLISGSNDYYDVSVTQDPCDPNDYRSYVVDCEAYQRRGGEKVGRSRLSAQLRLDPCIALWTGADTIFRPGYVLCGDAYCDGTLTNLGTIDGDIFGSLLSGPAQGSIKPAGDLPTLLSWPPVTSAYVNPNYSICSIGPGEVIPMTYKPAAIWHCVGDLMLSGNVIIGGMLLVEGDLTIRGSGNEILAAKNLPALYVSGNLVIEEVDGLTIEGLAVVDGSAWVNARACNVHILGGLFINGSLEQTVSDSSATNADALVYGAPLPVVGRDGGALQFDGVDDYLQTLGNDSLQLSGDYYTLSVWLKPAATQKVGATVMARTSSAGWALYFDGSSPMKLCVSDPAGDWDPKITLSDLTVGDVWHHVAIIREGNTVSSYLDLDPVPRGQSTLAAGPAVGQGHLNIGVNRAADPASCYGGLIDDLRIYDCPVDPNFLPPSGSVGLIGHWKFDESGSDVTITAEPVKSAIAAWPSEGEQHWSQAAGAFFHDVHRDLE